MNVCIIGSYAKALVMTTDRIPLAGETLMGYNYRGTYGGKGSDMAVQAARLGARVSYVGVVGDDAFGKEFVDLMKQERIDTRFLRVTREQPTGTGFIIKDTQARNLIVVAPGANDLFNEGDIDVANAAVREADVLLAQLEIPIATALYAMKQGKRAGKTTILNPAPGVDLTAYDLSDVSILTPNETEARIAAGLPPNSPLSNKDIAKILLNTGCGCVVTTLGDKGAAVFSNDESFEVEHYEINVVDSNGAGDSFNAALAATLAGGATLRESVSRANAAAALCCTRWETVPSYHTKQEVDAFLQSRKGG